MTTEHGLKKMMHKYVNQNCREQTSIRRITVATAQVCS
jgi:hypothetical protein